MVIAQNLVAGGPLYVLLVFSLVWFFTSDRKWKNQIVPHHSLQRKHMGSALLLAALFGGGFCFVLAMSIALENAKALQAGTLNIGDPNPFAEPYLGFIAQIALAFAAVPFAWLFRYGLVEQDGYSDAPAQTQNDQRSFKGVRAQSGISIFWLLSPILIGVLGVVAFLGYQFAYTFTTNEGYASLQCELYTKARLTDPDSFKPLRSSVSIDPYENDSKMLVVFLDFTSANAFGGRVKDTMVCSWTMESGSDEWRWNGPSPGRWSFKSLSRDRF